MKPRKEQTMDGNTAAAYASYAFTDAAIIYPITPSSPMAESIDEWAAKGMKNIFGQTVELREMQSEGGAAGTLHGCLQGGALASTYTASQGLLLMIPNMYKVAGELLPSVFHVSARSLASNALSIFGDHQDVMATRQTGFSLLASSTVQQCMDLGAVAHLAAIKSRVPALHFFDGFRTSHEVQKVKLLEYGELAGLVDMDAVTAFRRRALNPDKPVLRGTTQNPDVFFQTREAVNRFYEPLPAVYQGYMDEINRLTGSDYRLFNYFGSDTAEQVIIAMGSGCDVIRETIEYENARGGNLGLLEVHLFRPFSAGHMIEALPDGVKRITVLDRTKEPGALGEPLYQDVKTAYYNKTSAPLIVGGRYGLASKEFTPSHVKAVLDNMACDTPKDQFTVGIEDDVTFKSLPTYTAPFNPTPSDTIACKFWGLGSDGTVGANKSAIKIIGDHTNKQVQAYFAYDSKKSGGVTISHLRFGDSPIKSAYQITNADFIACHNQAYVRRYDILDGIKEGGTFLLNCVWDKKGLETELPASLKRIIAAKEVSFFTINAVDLAKKIGLGNRINMIMQSAFFALTRVMDVDKAADCLKKEVEKNYGRKGKKVVEMNWKAIDYGLTSYMEVKVPENWAAAKDEPLQEAELPDFVKTIMIPMNRQKGDDLPVSAFSGREDGTYPTGTTKYEKRAIAIDVAHWDGTKCIQCNQCAFVCPHAVLRPLILTKDQAQKVPCGMPVVPARGKGYEGFYTMGFSALDCTGCGNCIDVCPAREKALTMEPLADRRADYERFWEFAVNHVPPVLSDRQKATVKGSQFLTPLIEFSGACAGCAETPYAKLITQLFGDRMVISNSAGCTTVWGGSAPAVPYTTNAAGHGPAWGFSLFEDNAEYGYGMHVGTKTVRKTLADKVQEVLKNSVADPDVALALEQWLAGWQESEGTRKRAEQLKTALKKAGKDKKLAKIAALSQYFVKPSNWVFGGDGWAYDIGYGGVDHVLASGEDINLMVFDTEVYSNTGGQSSKSTPTGAIAKFATAGKRVQKKDLGMMAISYGTVYVAQVSMGADRNQTLKAVMEAEAYPGPSLIIGYAPCINHGIKGGMGRSQAQAGRAVDAGYWHLYRYNPALREQGLNPFTLDSKPPKADFNEFLMSEVRFAALAKQSPRLSAELFARAKEEADLRLQRYTRLAGKA